ncbi:hypothetical protein Pan2_21 [Pseudanabaena phage Pan2]|nr:hypothetical protein Pan2_21 [Pseudanabaena phage Pan2]
MATLNNVQSVGDDQRFKEELVREILNLKKRVEILEAQTNSRSR